MFLGLFAGSVVDRLDTLRLVIWTQAAAMLVSAGLAFVTLTGTATLPVVYVLAALGGVTLVLDAPGRQTLTFQMVGPSELPNAVALNSGLLNASRVIGPALAGVLIASVGTGICFLINTVSFLAVLAALVLMRESELYPHQRSDRDRVAGTREGLRFAWADAQTRAVLSVVTVVGLVGLNFNTLVPLLASDTLHVNARTFGLLSAAFGLGALGGALATASFRHATWRAFAGGVVGFSLLMLALAPIRSAWPATILLVGVGACFHAVLRRTRTRSSSSPRPSICAGASWRSTCSHSSGWRPSARFCPAGSSRPAAPRSRSRSPVSPACSRSSRLGVAPARAYDGRCFGRSLTRLLLTGRVEGYAFPVPGMGRSDCALARQYAGAALSIQEKAEMTIFGNRDSGYGGLPSVEQESVPIEVEGEPPAHPHRALEWTTAGSSCECTVAMTSSSGWRRAGSPPCRSPATWCSISNRRPHVASGRRSTSVSYAREQSSRSTYNGPNSSTEGRRKARGITIMATRRELAALPVDDRTTMEEAVALLEHFTSPPLDRAAEWTPSELRRVVIRLSDGEVVQVGTAPNRDSALVLARTVISEIEEPRGEWPLVGDRLLRPESVLSVDVLTTG